MGCIDRVHISFQALLTLDVGGRRPHRTATASAVRVHGHSLSQLVVGQVWICGASKSQARLRADDSKTTLCEKAKAGRYLRRVLDKLVCKENAGNEMSDILSVTCSVLGPNG